ncbi:MAG TPA: type II secretion system protein GspM [Rhodanobacteraceae bacterium]|jgi:general secretion pathway protein M|nr:type II secretion system protein GspM [Rhodanobacteraceae bacterium]
MRIDTRRVTPLQSRIAAVALALVALLAAYFLLLHWWFVAPLLGVDGQMHGLRQLHAKYAAAIAEQPELKRRVATLERGGASVNAFLAAADPSTASADLIQRASDVVAAHAHEGAGCNMPSKMPIEQDSGNEPFRRVSVSITLDCGMQPLAAVLHDFDRGLPYLFVDNLTIARSPTGRMQAQLSLSGYLRPSGTLP